jgi:Fe-Mn family superoxide dismutase
VAQPAGPVILLQSHLAPEFKPFKEDWAMTDRRGFLATALGTASAALLPTVGRAEEPFTLEKLPYAFDALEPHIDAKTMEIHWGRHHKAYVDNLNKAVAGKEDLASKSIERLMIDVNSVPAAIRGAVINNGGGHYNHSVFWSLMKKDGGGEPTGATAKAIDGAFGSYAKFQEKLSTAAMTRFGSGWAWLVVNQMGMMDVVSFPNQDCPLSAGLKPVMGVDVWEHAYYLKYQNKRADYLKAWFNTLNWDAIGERLSQALKKD